MTNNTTIHLTFPRESGDLSLPREKGAKFRESSPQPLRSRNTRPLSSMTRDFSSRAAEREGVGVGGRPFKSTLHRSRRKRRRGWVIGRLQFSLLQPRTRPILSTPTHPSSYLHRWLWNITSVSPPWRKNKNPKNKKRVWSRLAPTSRIRATKNLPRVLELSSLLPIDRREESLRLIARERGCPLTINGRKGEWIRPVNIATAIKTRSFPSDCVC